MTLFIKMLLNPSHPASLKAQLCMVMGLLVRHATFIHADLRCAANRQPRAAQAFSLDSIIYAHCTLHNVPSNLCYLVKPVKFASTQELATKNFARTRLLKLELLNSFLLM